MSLFVSDVGASEAFYTETMGFVRTEAVTYKGHRCVFLRNGGEHHSLALFPKALRGELGLNAGTSVATMGMQVGSYRQLKDAVAFLKKNGARFTDAGAGRALSRRRLCGAHRRSGRALLDALLLHGARRLGRPAAATASERRKVGKEWPESLEPMSDTYADPAFMGPLG